MNKKILLLLLAFACSAFAFAKRMAPAEISPVVYQEKVYVADTWHSINFGGGMLRIYDQASGAQIKVKLMYFNFYIPFMEKDVQWVEWKSMKLEQNGILFLENEKGKTFRVEL